jgi:protocatechuate 3,4-dioxygenase beta subunit
LQLARYDLTESQTYVLIPSQYARLIFILHSGVELILDIGVLDISTCKPLKNVFVEIWAGKYF